MDLQHLPAEFDEMEVRLPPPLQRLILGYVGPLGCGADFKYFAARHRSVMIAQKKFVQQLHLCPLFAGEDGAYSVLHSIRVLAVATDAENHSLLDCANAMKWPRYKHFATWCQRRWMPCSFEQDEKAQLEAAC